jgi:GxxExxY protein
MDLNYISGQVIDASMKVHSALGPGLLEHAYQACLKHEIIKRSIRVISEVGMPVLYDGISIDLGYRLDLLVENQVIVELKSQVAITPLHRSQLMTYLRLSNKPLGLIINFGQRHLKDGIQRIAN